jgi:glutamine cyclotransferase
MSMPNCKSPPNHQQYEIVRSYFHDPTSFTQGLFYHNGFIYEATGLHGRSSIRKTRIETGEVLQRSDLPPEYFGEGIVNWEDRILQLTWTSHVGFIYDLETLSKTGEFTYSDEGWGLAQDGERIIMSDGSAQLRFLDPNTLQETGRITVTDNHLPVKSLNDLEWVNGEIFANVLKSSAIARIDPANGQVKGWIDLEALVKEIQQIDPVGLEGDPNRRFLNGIAFDPRSNRLFFTGKLWPRLFEIRLLDQHSVSGNLMR